MKKFNYLMGALALAAFASCSSDDVTTNVKDLQKDLQTRESIGFSPLTKNATRSTVYNSLADITSFKVRGYWDTQSLAAIDSTGTENVKNIFINGYELATPTVTVGAAYTGGASASDAGFGTGVEIAYNNGGWNYKNSGDTQYWGFVPTWGKKKATGTGSNAGSDDGEEYSVITDYTCIPLSFSAVAPASADVDLSKDTWSYTGKPVASQVDVLYAIAENKTNADAPVDMHFNHVFSQIIVKAKKANDYTVDIKEVMIGGVLPNGTLTLASVTGPGVATWAATGTATTVYGYNSANPYTVASSAADESPVQITPAGQELLLVPQTTVAWNPKDGEPTDNAAYIAITYRAKKSTAENWATTGTDGYTTTYYPLEASWKNGKIYAYTLLFGGVADPDDKPENKDPENPDPGEDQPGGWSKDGSVNPPTVPITFKASYTDWESSVVDVKF